MTTSDTWSFETRQIHAGQSPDATTHSRALPIYQTTSYTFDSTDHAAALFGLAEPGNIYTRLMTPTTDVVEQRIASLEGGVAALLLASGQAAETFAILTLAGAGDHIVSSPRLYGGTYNLLHYSLPKLGIETTFVEDPDDLDSWQAAVRPNTKAFFAETISNPKIDILDIPGVAGVAHANGVPLIVDNTIATPYLIQPLAHGADIVVHSATKYLGGHGTAIAGVMSWPFLTITLSVRGSMTDSHAVRPLMSSRSGTSTSSPLYTGALRTPRLVPQSCSSTTTLCATSHNLRVR